jgi:hypothetical protein
MQPPAAQAAAGAPVNPAPVASSAAAASDTGAVAPTPAVQPGVAGVGAGVTSANLAAGAPPAAPAVPNLAAAAAVVTAATAAAAPPVPQAPLLQQQQAFAPLRTGLAAMVGAGLAVGKEWVRDGTGKVRERPWRARWRLKFTPKDDDLLLLEGGGGRDEESGGVSGTAGISRPGLRSAEVYDAATMTAAFASHGGIGGGGEGSGAPVHHDDSWAFPDGGGDEQRFGGGGASDVGAVFCCVQLRVDAEAARGLLAPQQATSSFMGGAGGGGDAAPLAGGPARSSAAAAAVASFLGIGGAGALSDGLSGSAARPAHHLRAGHLLLLSVHAPLVLCNLLPYKFDFRLRAVQELPASSLAKAKPLFKGAPPLPLRDEREKEAVAFQHSRSAANASDAQRAKWSSKVRRTHRAALYHHLQLEETGTHAYSRSFPSPHFTAHSLARST